MKDKDSTWWERNNGQLKRWAMRGAAAILALLPIGAVALLVSRAPPDLVAPTDPAEFWTLVAAVSAVLALSVTIGVGVIAWYGLRSIRLARQDMVTRATRESRAMALSKAQEFSDMISGESAEIRTDLTAKGIPWFTQKLPNRGAVFDDDDLYPVAKDWWTKLPADLQNRIIGFLNELEAWSMYFTKELADESVISEPCAPTYISLVMLFSPWIIVVRKEQYPFYPNVIKLFEAWRAELEARNVGKGTEAALLAANEAEERKKRHKITPPLGTKVDL